MPARPLSQEYLTGFLDDVSRAAPGRYLEAMRRRAAARAGGLRSHLHLGPTLVERAGLRALTHAELAKASSDDLEALHERLHDLDGRKRAIAKAGGTTILDYLTSRVHDGYARSADVVYALGHLSQDERKAVGQAVGEALKTYRDRIRASLGAAADRVIPVEDVRVALTKSAEQDLADMADIAYPHAQVVRAMQKRGLAHVPRFPLDFSGRSPFSHADLQNPDILKTFDQDDLRDAHEDLHRAYACAKEDLPRACPQVTMGPREAAWTVHGYKRSLVRAQPLADDQGYRAIASRPDLDGKRYVWGLAQLGPATPITKAQFRELEEEHRHTDAERQRLWPHEDRLWHIPVIQRVPFEHPVPVGSGPEALKQAVAQESSTHVWLPKAAVPLYPFGPILGKGAASQAIEDLLGSHARLVEEMHRRGQPNLEESDPLTELHATYQAKNVAGAQPSSVHVDAPIGSQVGADPDKDRSHPRPRRLPGNNVVEIGDRTPQAPIGGGWRTAKFVAKAAKQQIVYGEVMVPHEVDTQDDFATPQVIADTAHRWLARYRVAGEQHSKEARPYEVYESYIAPQDLKLGTRTIAKDSWILAMHVIDKGLWRDIEDGKYTGYSIGGFGESEAATKQDMIRLALAAEVEKAEGTGKDDDEDDDTKKTKVKVKVKITEPKDAKPIKDIVVHVKKADLDETAHEYRWRVRAPGLFDPDTYGRTPMTGAGAGIDKVTARPKGSEGGTRIQSLAFPKPRWTEAKVQDWIAEHGDPIREEALRPAAKADTEATVIIVRHGSTAFNRGGVGHDKIRGQMNLPLDAAGKKQAEALAARLKSAPVTHVVSSDLDRTMETARAIAAEHPGITAHPMKALRSWALGDLEGQDADGPAVKEIVRLVNHEDETPAGGGEPFRAFKTRYIGALAHILATAKPGDCIVLVTHARGLQLADLWLKSDRDIAEMTEHYADDLAKEPDAVRPGGYLRLDREGPGDWEVTDSYKEPTDGRSHPAS